jgi:hypothetical protein
VGGTGDADELFLAGDGSGESVGVAVHVPGFGFGDQEEGRSLQLRGRRFALAVHIHRVEAHPGIHGRVSGREQSGESAHRKAHEAHATPGAILFDQRGQNTAIELMIGETGLGRHDDEKAIAGQMTAPTTHVAFGAGKTMRDDDER